MQLIDYLAELARLEFYVFGDVYEGVAEKVIKVISGLNCPVVLALNFVPLLFLHTLRLCALDLVLVFKDSN